MPHAQPSDADLYYEVAGDGEPLLLVHGSWTDHNSRRPVVPGPTASYRVVTCDRRGHGRSTGPAGPGARTQDERGVLVEALRHDAPG
ncbi:hypothetical protein [Embleya sp. NPDC005575]|uniref:alpha/beta fold hydrolase n=1 Tax=Embleya sp. NPDC005575 TaxID=3156892 RepID=UPI00339FD333